MNYKIVGNKIIETQTGLTVAEQTDKNFLKHLNFGGGFDGFTPDFFTYRLKDKK